MNIINELLNSFDISKGSTVFVSSDVLRQLIRGYRTGVPFNPTIFIDGLIEMIGPQGTLLFPTYNWDYCQGIAFDYKRTVSRTGILGQAALQRNDFKRTQHPIYSFAVWGKDQEYLCNLSNISSFGSDSPFSYLRKQNALNIMIDVDYTNCFTFVHYVEEQTNNVTYRYQKMFSAKYIDEMGNIRDSHYSMFVRDLDLDVQTVINKIGLVLEKEGVSQKYIVNDTPIISLHMGDAYPIIEDDILNNRSRNICTYKGQDD